MELLIIEVLLWIGFVFLLWAMRESLIRIEHDIEFRQPDATAPARPGPCQPQSLTDPIGQYHGQIIHEYAVIDGRQYRFDHVCPTPKRGSLPDDARWIAPGLVYIECALPFTARSGA